MPRHTEPTANSLLGGMLAGMLQTYDVLSENTQQLWVVRACSLLGVLR